MYGRDWSSQALRPFVRGVNAPYVEGGVRVTSATAREDVAIGSPVNRDLYHLIDSLAAAWVDDRMILGARWLCGAGSIGVKVYSTQRLDEFYAPFFEDDRSVDDQVCLKCRAVRDGIEPLACVYRAYDKAGQLLYIGSTKNWGRRQGQHRSKTWWWPAVKRVDLEHFSTVKEAREAEALAIADEHPRMNIAHNRSGASA